MAATTISRAQAWEHVLRARRFDWQRGLSYQHGPISITAGGEWHCSDDIDAPASQLLDIMLPLVARTTPLVMAQLGQSLDGRIATECGASYYVTGQQGLVHLHALRAVVDAVVVGAGTVAMDDPRLTVRHVAGENPVRVVLDPRGRMSESRFVFEDDSAPTLHLVGHEHVARWQACHERHGRGVSVGGLGLKEDGVDPREVIDLLRHQGLNSVLVEGGGMTISRFLQEGCLNRLHSMVTPMIIGSGRPTLTLPVIECLSQAMRPSARHYTLGDDVLFDLDLGAVAQTDRN
ncbi:RibD family protein [Kushneria indalinina]|uniref:Riboflavin-specific deaminase-like protein n=1 Tax=Kushneria indalinina DSM 14324 TaxID=1122140 RepID=A0A3D9DYG3_9GAMM|nr:dihydrofolate reductase family protein [Kushneria indalinina]REC95827.1 riboflavin-specific deaminase-like protein [Kushneria indalinina DSM 14324]